MSVKTLCGPILSQSFQQQNRVYVAGLFSWTQQIISVLQQGNSTSEDQILQIASHRSSGKWVQVSCRPLNVNANRYWLLECNVMKKKAEHKSVTVSLFQCGGSDARMKLEIGHIRSSGNYNVVSSLQILYKSTFVKFCNGQNGSVAWILCLYQYTLIQERLS